MRTFHYISIPGHTPKDYQSDNTAQFEKFRADYLRGSEELLPIIDGLVESVRMKKDDSILFIFGDHGAWLSRTVLSDEDIDFFVQDRHGVVAAVLVNRTGCNSRQLRHYSGDGFTTPERILAGLIRCLSQDPGRIDAAVDFREAFEMDKFLYE